MTQKLAIQKLNQLKDIKPSLVDNYDHILLKMTKDKKRINFIIDKYNLKNL